MRRSPRGSPSASTPGTTSPCSPRVATTRVTRWPSAAAFAMVPPVWIDSSSGWAWKQTSEATSGDRPRGPQAGDLVLAEPGLAEDLVGVLAGVGGGAGDAAGRAAEAGGGVGLGYSGHLDEGLPVDVVGVVGRLVHGEDGGEAHVGGLHDLAPLVAGLGLHHAGELVPQLGPGRAVHLAGLV